MATAVGTPYSPPSPPDTSSSATMSPVYPDRPIRPLPKRSLRARLSPEVADQIPFPAAPQPNNPGFHNYRENMAQQNGANIKNAAQEVDKALIVSDREYGTQGRDGYRFRGTAVDSDDEEHLSMVRRLEEYQIQQGIIPIPSQGLLNGVPHHSDGLSHSVVSSNDSVDGYDSFENTNNKKKRKIPTSGGLGAHQNTLSTSLSNDLANMGISNPRDNIISSDGSGDSVNHYYGSGSLAAPITGTGTGISGAGRGRYGRTARRDLSGRSPLGIATGNASNTWQIGRTSGARREYPIGAANKDTHTDHGIISAAIAEAAVLPPNPNNGRENISLLDQQSAKKPTPANSQFTFTCEPDSTKGVSWPGESPQFHRNTYPSAPESLSPQASQPSQSSKGFSTQGTQTSPTMASQNGQGATIPQASGQQQVQSNSKPRRPPSKRYAIAERQRRMQQQYNNYHHPPREEDVWICEFCEYESIFGVPPVALVRQYEIKDSRERKRLAEKRRLLEKAKMKGRKGKKGNKNSGKSNAVNAQQPQQQSTQQSNNQLQGDSATTNHQGTQSDDYYVEDYDEDVPDHLLSGREVSNKAHRPMAQPKRQSPHTVQANGA